MSNTIRLKRRAAGGAAGAPSTLQQAEPAYNETDNTLYIGVGTGGAGGSATSIVPIGGQGAFVDRTTAQTIAGVKTFSSTPIHPTPAAGDNTTNSATTAFVNTAAASIAVQQIAAAAGVSICPLDSNQLVPAANLPSYVDDVLEYNNLSAFPTTGEKGKIYIADDTNYEYRWSGSVYIRIVASPGTTDALAEGTVNLYFTTARVLATVLTGLSTATATVVAASDSLLVALGKLQAQVTARLVSANNLSDLASASAARTNLGLGTIDNITLDGGLF